MLRTEEISTIKHLKVFLVVKWRLKNSGREHRIKISLVQTYPPSMFRERGGREEGGGREWTNIQAPRTISGDEYRILKTFFNRGRKGKSKWIDKNICKFPLLCSPPLEKYN